MARMKIPDFRTDMTECPVCGSNTIILTIPCFINFDGDLILPDVIGHTIGKCNNPACTAEFALDYSSLFWKNKESIRRCSDGYWHDVGYDLIKDRNLIHVHIKPRKEIFNEGKILLRAKEQRQLEQT